ncbi:LysE family translocator [Pacificoceanicola onchidii]|uniref:LysE family translocator n=1 Tax=Pacificoceanicola onchidii TaxID=2562685 RepID=UPI0010A640F0|nr:LysE family translocator [Pacificoceanicola onchidii]
MSLLAGILTAYTILLVGTLSPGPAVALLLGIASSEGRRAALTTCAGIALGSMTLNLLTLAGIGLLLSQVAWAMQALKAFGTAYLLWLAYGAFRRAMRPPAVTRVKTGTRGTVARLVQGYLLQVTNPKAVGFWLAISAVGAVTNASLPVIALYVLCGGVISFFGHAAWGFALSSRPFQNAYAAARGKIEAALGLVFGFAAFKLATSEV